jgi:hypothetical protein
VLYTPVHRQLQILNELESAYGVQGPHWPTDPYLFLVWWHSGYPASDASCAKGWESLNKTIGVSPEQIFRAPDEKLASALRSGGNGSGGQGGSAEANRDSRVE